MGAGRFPGIEFHPAFHAYGIHDAHLDSGPGVSGSADLNPAAHSNLDAAAASAMGVGQEVLQAGHDPLAQATDDGPILYETGDPAVGILDAVAIMVLRAVIHVNLDGFQIPPPGKGAPHQTWRGAKGEGWSRALARILKERPQASAVASMEEDQRAA